MGEMNKHTLSEAIFEADKVEQMLIDSGGEITEEIEMALVVSEKALEQSIDKEVQKIERVEYVAEHYKRKAKIFANIAKNMANYIERREEQIKDYMMAHNLEVMSGQEYEYFLAKPTCSVEVVDDLLLPEKFFKIEKKPLKIEIKAALDSGEQVPGVKLKESRSLRTRIFRGKK
jgi:hypothetical protein